MLDCRYCAYNIIGVARHFNIESGRSARGRVFGSGGDQDLLLGLLPRRKRSSASKAGKSSVESAVGEASLAGGLEVRIARE